MAHKASGGRIPQAHSWMSPMNMPEKTMSDDRSPESIPARGLVGALDGRTIVRFAHAFATGGGVERYLDDLDHSLLSRNAVTIIRIFIGSPGALSESKEAIGRGTLIKIPLPLADRENLQIAPDSEPTGIQWRSLFRDWILYNPVTWHLWTRRYLTNWKIALRPGQVVGAGRVIEGLYASGRGDLTMLHFFGGGDADEVVERSRSARVPYAVLNHFSNDRFSNLSIRKHVLFASGVSGVSGIGAPRYLRKNFQNLSDGIDVDFFHPSKGVIRKQSPDLPLVLLPARVVRTKGHLDLVDAAARLMKMGIDFNVGFVGRTGSAKFEDELRKTTGALGLSERVHFLGELSVEDLRDWYKSASIVAFPTYHHEGLPRILLEAQAMQVPVVAYATGGTAEGLIADKTGILLKTGDVAGLADGLRKLLADEAMRISMGRAGRQLVEKTFSLGALAARHEEFYTGIISEHNRGPRL
jgi:glycosyltransferase involved in cell wall biosynthesis